MARFTGLIKEIAKELSNEQKKVTFEQVGNVLNELGIKTTYGTEFSGERGTAKIIHDSYKDLIKQGDMDGAEKITTSFSDKNGNFPWDK